MSHQRRVLILGADGFIGRHIAFGLRNAGWAVLASARRTDRLDRMGFETLKADLTDPATHTTEFWQPHLQGVDHVVNAAGLLTGSQSAFFAVHVAAPDALYQAMPTGTTGVLLSAIGIATADTSFASFRRTGEQIATKRNITILRAGLVLADTSHGGSSLARALAALPLMTPVVGKGDQPFNPIHADDLTQVIHDCLLTPPGPVPHEIGGPEQVTQSEMLRALRAWLGLPRTRILRMPIAFARILGRIGDILRLGPISDNAVRQLDAGVLADSSALLAKLPSRPRGFSTFLSARPAGSQDLWHARLYLMRPTLRLTLAFLWLASGALGLAVPSAQFLPLLANSGLPDWLLIALARLGGLVDIAIAIALFRAYNLRILAWLQIAMIAIYTLAFTLLAPGLWLLPLGGLLKNVPLIVLVALHGILEDER